MAALKPHTVLPTHAVDNQPPPFEDVNLYTSDTVLQAAIGRSAAADWAPKPLTAFGAEVGTAETAHLAAAANAHPPSLQAFDRYGHRIDEVSFHPAYHALMAMGLEAGVSAAAWCAQRDGKGGGHSAHAALLYLMGQAECSVVCPMTMTYAAVPALRQQPEIAADWIPRLLSQNYDPASRPAADKAGATVGMAMTEKQGGSDVRANTTRAEAEGAGGPGQAYRLTGHKWFCSAPMSDGFLTLALAPGGLSCFFVPRWTPDGERNVFRIQRLKDKLGDRANASAEIEYDRTYGLLIGEEGRGVRTIIEMVHHTRLDTAIAPALLIRQALAQALWHTAHRTAFQKRLIDQPLMRRVLSDLAIESEAATALAFRVALSFDNAAGNEAEALRMRLITPAAKYWLNKRVVPAVHEAMECHGGAGYIEESPLPRIYRQAPLNGIWEGSGNVICLDVLRALHKTPAAAEALADELQAVRGRNTVYDAALDGLLSRFKGGAPAEAEARLLTEEIAVILQAATLLAHAPDFVAEGFCATRLAGRPACFGATHAPLAEDRLLNRAMPVL